MDEEKEKLRSELQCILYPLNYLKSYKYVVVCSYYQGRWVLSKHKQRDTWETQGGHIEQNETPLDCAKRELYEESGIKDADLYPVCDYYGYRSNSSSNGVVFLAVVHAFHTMPQSEMKEIRLFETIPSQLTYPKASPKFYEEAYKLLLKIKEK